jgi:hypothetical protein
MANRNATFAKRQRETDLKDRAKQKEERRAQKRNEVRENKGPQIAWGEAVHAVTTDDENGEMPSLANANQDTHHDVPTDDDAPGPRGPGAPPFSGPRR